MTSNSGERATSVHVLVVEDEGKTRQALAEGFSMESWAVSTAETGREALVKLANEPFDLVVLDWMLPDREGIEIVQKLRQNSLDVPVLLLTARTAASDRALGLESGADAYLSKPFAFAELLAHCRALVHRFPALAEPLLKCGDLHLDTAARRVKRAGQAIDLAPREVDLLEYLMRWAGQIITSEMLERDVWKRAVRTGALDGLIDVHVSRLRQKIDGERSDRLIHTVRGIGYRLGVRGE